MTRASPAITASRSGKWRAQWPTVWPGVKTTRGEPGTSSTPSAKGWVCRTGGGQKARVARKPRTWGSPAFETCFLFVNENNRRYDSPMHLHNHRGETLSREISIPSKGTLIESVDASVSK